jgi:excisionase family DNA binding protein
VENHQQALAGLRGGAVSVSDGAWTFADTETQWRHEVLSDLVTGLVRFQDAKKGAFTATLEITQIWLYTIRIIRFVGIGEAAAVLGVSPQTLRRWEREGKLNAHECTPGGHRRYDLAKLRPQLFHRTADDRLTIGYARVSSHDQKADLERQKKMLELFCAQNGWRFEIIADLGSGMNYRKRGLRRLLEKIVAGEVGRLVLTHKDRLLRFGAELVFSLCEAKETEVVLINHGSEPTLEEELVQDVLEMITVFSARLYGSRSRKNKKLMEEMKKAVTEADGEGSRGRKTPARRRRR